MCISSNEVVFFNPECFEPCNYVPKKWAEYARYFIHKLYTHRIYNKRAKSDWIPLKAAYLRKVMPKLHYKKIIDLLVRHEVVYKDPNYIIGRQCMKYRLSDELINQCHTRYVVKSKRLIAKLVKARQGRCKPQTDVHVHLLRYLNQVEVVGDCPDLSLDMIRNRDFFFHHDEFGRVHTNLTNLKRECRSCITWRNRRLVNLDIKNSQPLFLAVLLINWYQNNNHLQSLNSFYSSMSCFCQGEEGISPFTMSNSLDHQKAKQLQTSRTAFDEFSQEEGKGTSPFTMSNSGQQEVVEQGQLPEDVERYLRLVQDGRLYEFLAESFGLTREESKKLFLVLFFGRNYKCKERDTINDLFPNVMKVVNELKKKDYRHLAQLLQKMESVIVINRIARRFMNEHQDQFIATIHDSIIVSDNMVKTGLEIINDAFMECGVRPTVKVEPLTAET